ncbi:hypothetical protein ACA910_014839 [Epithemia clementina (nom. ined.)]
MIRKRPVALDRCLLSSSDMVNGGGTVWRQLLLPLSRNNNNNNNNKAATVTTTTAAATTKDRCHSVVVVPTTISRRSTAFTAPRLLSQQQQQQDDCQSSSNNNNHHHNHRFLASSFAPATVSRRVVGLNCLGLDCHQPSPSAAQLSYSSSSSICNRMYHDRTRTLSLQQRQMPSLSLIFATPHHRSLTPWQRLSSSRRVLSSSSSTCSWFSASSLQSTSATTASDSKSSTELPLVLQQRHDALLRMPQELDEMEFSDNRYELHRHGRGESYHASQPPGLIVYCKSTDQVQQVVRYCVQHKIPMIPFGAGTSLEGHVQAVEPYTLSIDLAKYMTTIHSIPNPSSSNSNNNNTNDQQQQQHQDAYAIVDAGVTRLQLQAALKHSGYLFSVDPGADATLGGMASTGASGTTTVKWGTMKDNLLSMTAVLATTPEAPIVQTGTKALKNSAGYDLTSLLCGSEGTLGIITQLFVKLHPVPAHLVAVSCAFPTLQDAANAVSTLMQCNVDMVRCELLDATSMQVFDNATTNNNKATTTNTTRTSNNDQQGKKYKPTLFLELAGVTEAALEEQVALVRELLLFSEENGSEEQEQEFRLAYDLIDRNELWKARHGLYYNAITAGGGAGAQAIVTDACVPLSQLANVIVATAQDVAQEEGVLGPCFGHAGDGNFHCILAVPQQYLPTNNNANSNNDDAKDSERTGDSLTIYTNEQGSEIDEKAIYWDKLRRIQKNLIRRTLAVGGTCTGEHGIGVSKRPYMLQQYTPETLHTMRLIKQALDPYNLMNPGKIFFSSSEEEEKLRNDAAR